MSRLVAVRVAVSPSHTKFGVSGYTETVAHEGKNDFNLFPAEEHQSTSHVGIQFSIGRMGAQSSTAVRIASCPFVNEGYGGHPSKSFFTTDSLVPTL